MKKINYFGDKFYKHLYFDTFTKIGVYLNTCQGVWLFYTDAESI